MELLKTLVNDSVKLGKYRFLKFQNRTFCSKALCSVLRINKNTFSRAIGMNNNNNAATIPGRKSRNREESSLHLMNWLESYATYHEDMMPDEEDIYLPYKTIKVDLYWNYKTETSLPVCKSQFFKTCSSYCPHLQIKKVKILNNNLKHNSYLFYKVMSFYLVTICLISVCKRFIPQTTRNIE